MIFKPSEVMVPRVITPLPLFQQFNRIGGNLTPGEVSSILRQADSGHIERYIDLLNESRQKDGHLQSILGTREMAVKRLSWKVVVPDDASERERAAADLMNEVWHETAGGEDDSVGTPDMLHHLQLAPYYGFSVPETNWMVDSGRMIPEGWWLTPHRRFIFDLRDGKLKHSDFGRQSAGVDLRVEHPGKFIQYQPIINGDVKAREGLGRVLVWAALFRNWDLRDWLTLAEIGWKPWRLGQYKKGANKEDIAALVNALKSITTSGVAVLPETAELEIKWPEGQVVSTQGGKSAHSELFGTLKDEMSKAVLGQTLTSDSGDKGTKALGTVHERVREDIRDGDAWSIAAVLRRDLWTPLVSLNFGDEIRVPAHVPITDEDVDMLAFSDAVEKLRQGGMTQIGQKWVRDQLNIPEPADGDELIIPVEVTEPVSE